VAPLVNPAFWRGRRVFLTGHTGFKGSWLTVWLEHLGAVVTGYALGVPTTRSFYESAGVAEGIRSITGDVRDVAAVTSAMEQARPEVVFHLAAQSLVRRSHEEPVETFSTNVVGTANVLEAVRGLDGIRSVVVATSDKCYRRSETAHSEDDPLGGEDPYSASKAAAELVTAAYRDSYFSSEGPAVATVRAGNVIGGGDWAQDRLVPDVMRAALDGSTVVVRNPGHVRPWQHVLGPLAGYLGLAERLEEDQKFATAWNFGPAEDEARPVEWVVDALIERWPAPVAVSLEDDRGGALEAGALRLDSSRARELLGWRAWPLDAALDATAEWYRAFAAGEDVRRVALAQIARYEADTSR
jgi:CDP-glucose 4,6-dehydratase